ncbi:phenylalanyl-tRNA synthetase, alpha subunit [Sphingomonas guangdongensis]|uniref:Phenylalanine--tRNA ligase alpha subunit n=1 Tax=Sphingomonas guangdongensis TaxID=1141890 RepID=A0A285QBQ7_9SPHN|nr:phenylalanine--tRNA ligase subunit alpha [Sphingomonas guangdongensis]SOB78948.1 phenylalanyl-tRNA synthetase, alpha subunit [Sphingomonas guangdongensis]
MTTDLDQLRTDLLAAIDAAAGLDALDAVRVHALGKQGCVTVLLKTLGAMSPEERQAAGPRIHGLREAVTSAIAERKTRMEQAVLDARLAAERIDLTLPVDLPPPGNVHPVAQVMDELAEIFADLGFAVATGPEIEDDWHNFTALNIPETHPARAMHDTFYVERIGTSTAGAAQAATDDGGSAAGASERMVLRTHTSPVQIRAMLAAGGDKPVRIIAPGRTYRSDSDATHTPMFHQVEGLVIDRGITMGHLKWTLETFLKAFFERDDIVLRLRPSYFPFTEPSAEVDVGYTIQNGKRVIGGSDGWMEVLGSGMVHRKVIAAGGYDPDVWQGFAFGCGIDRLAMLKYGMDDLRAFFDGDLRWLRHYGFGALDVPTLSGGVGA